ncbi:sugar kinase [uncultured Rhodoferax sp.]|uniref:sugar kinase n=1 Tax=uncultured Rhodoferax sp. TaxID=223188 RepID=UPI0025F32CA3|nr:sugar kinase [uncultured Rhodoferax sp.]
MSLTTEHLDVLSIGETMALLVAQEPGPLESVQSFSKRIAGADTNVAIGLARLGFRVGWVSRLGADSFGRFVRKAVEAEGVDTSQVEVDPQRSTGFMLKSRSVDGSDPAIEYYRRGSAASQLSPAHLPAAYARRARHVHATGITPALSPDARALVAHAMRSLRSQGGTVSFDPNLRPSLWPDTATMRDTLNDLARHADWVLPGIAEARLLTGQQTPADMAAWYLDQGVRAVVIKLGAEGAYFRTADGQQGQVPGVPVPVVVDTVGAGDAFAVGIISAQLEGLDWPQAVRRANWIASRALQVIGDMEGLPHRHELEHNFLQNQGPTPC